jgi:S-phase kinase-associated protein 1
MTDANKSVVLKTNDQTQFEVSRQEAELSAVVKQMLEDLPDSDEPIPLMDKSTTGPVVENVVAWMKGYVLVDTDDDKIKFSTEFVQQFEDDMLFNVILAANYMDIRPLQDAGCKMVAEEIKKCKTPEEIRTRFNIVNDFTPEEEEEIKKENAWCLE